MNEQSATSQIQLVTELEPSSMETSSSSDLRLQRLSESIARIKNVNHKLDDLIMSRLEFLPIDKQHEILRKRAEGKRT